MSLSAHERMKRALTYIGERGLSGLVAFSNGHNWIFDSNAIFVLTGSPSARRQRGGDRGER